MKTGLLWIAGLAGLLAGASLATHRRLERTRRAGLGEPLSRWEGEGGGVPVESGEGARNVRSTPADPATSGGGGTSHPH